MFISTAEEEAFIEHVAVTSANQSEVGYFPTFLQGLKTHEGKRLYGPVEKVEEFRKKFRC
ncbi:MAG: hypothetical protein LVR00_06345 [Rhabdochlamydiaceae bacterium]|jgi:hypothetical protein